VCLDFVNTTGARASGSPRERLTTYEDLLVWSERVGILQVPAITELRRTARDRPSNAARTLARAQALRETLYAIFSALAGERGPDARVVGELARRWRAARSRQELVSSKKGFRLRFIDGAELDHMIPPIVVSAVELLTSQRLRLLRRCVECDWLFLDESKNGKRRWCKSMCGNRARSRERYERLRTMERHVAKRQ
jgi:predicted RNA-binding Zn ribbon-like protein